MTLLSGNVRHRPARSRRSLLENLGSAPDAGRHYGSFRAGHELWNQEA